MKKIFFILTATLCMIFTLSSSVQASTLTIVSASRTKSLTSAEVGQIIAKAANKMYQNKNSFAYNLNNPFIKSTAFKGKKTRAYLCGTSSNYPGNQTKLGMKNKFFVDCSGFCMLTTYWSLGGITPAGGNFSFISSSKLGGNTSMKAVSKLKVGDVLQFNNHWGIYVGNNKMIHMVNNGVPSYQTWTLYKTDVRNWTAPLLGVYRMTDKQAAKIKLVNVDENLSKINF